MSDAKIVAMSIVGIATALVIGIGVILLSFHHQPRVETAMATSAVAVVPTTVPSNPVHQAEPAFTNFNRLEDFVGVECYYTHPTLDLAAFPVVGEDRKVQLTAMSKLTVTKVLHDELTDPDQSESYGYKMYAKTVAASEEFKVGDYPAKINAVPIKTPIVVVIYPTLFPLLAAEKEHTIMYLPLCPTSDYALAQSMWEGKRFTYGGTKIGDIEVEPHTVVSLSNIRPAEYGNGNATFDATWRLPSGVNVNFGVWGGDSLKIAQPQ